MSDLNGLEGAYAYIVNRCGVSGNQKVEFWCLKAYGTRNESKFCRSVCGGKMYD